MLYFVLHVYSNNKTLQCYILCSILFCFVSGQVGQIQTWIGQLQNQNSSWTCLREYIFELIVFCVTVCFVKLLLSTVLWNWNCWWHVSLQVPHSSFSLTLAIHFHTCHYQNVCTWFVFTQSLRMLEIYI